MLLCLLNPGRHERLCKVTPYSVCYSKVTSRTSALPALSQPPGQGAGDGGAGAPDRPGDHRGDGPSHPHQLLRHAELREPKDGRHQELVAGGSSWRETLQRRLQV